MANRGQHAGPPPPPPPPVGGRGPGNEAPFIVLGGGHRGGPPPLPPGARVGGHGPMPGPAHGHQGPPPPLPQMMQQQQQQQRRVHNSIQYSDITPRKPITEEDCRKKLTTYKLFQIRKQPDMKKDSVGTWAKVQFINESLAQEDIAKGIKRLNETTKSVAEKKAKLFPFQQQQVTKLLDEQISQETDQNFQWSLAQLDRDEKINKQGKRETLVICVYLKREPIRDISCVTLYTAIDRENKRREEALIRGPQPQQQQPMPQHHGPPPGHDDGHGQPKILKMDDKKGGKGGKGGKDRGRSRHYDHSDEESDSDSFYESDDSRSSFGSSTQATTISSRSNDRHRGRRRSHGRSFSRHRPEYKQHRIGYGRSNSPERPPPPTRPYVPDVPRQLPVSAIMPTADPVAAAYKAGRVDAEAERYGLADRYPREPERRYSPEPVRLVSSRLQPTAVVAYTAPVTRYQDALPMRPRYDDRFEEPIREVVREEYVRPVREEYVRYSPPSPRTEEFYRAREREVEDYVEYRRPRGGESYYDERIIYRRESRPRGYAASSTDSWALN